VFSSNVPHRSINFETFFKSAHSLPVKLFKILSRKLSVPPTPAAINSESVLVSEASAFSALLSISASYSPYLRKAYLLLSSSMSV